MGELGLSCENCGVEYRKDQYGVISLIDDDYSFSNVVAQNTAILKEIERLSYSEILDHADILEARYSEFSYEYGISGSRGAWTSICDFAGKTIIDIGGGYGSIAREIAKRGARFVYCVDLSLDRLRIGSVVASKEGVSNILFIRLDILKTKLCSKSIDSILMIGFFEYVGCSWSAKGPNPLEQRRAFLKEIGESLTDKGSLLIGIENKYSYIHFLGSTSHNEKPFTPLLPWPILLIIYNVVPLRNRAILHSHRGYSRLAKQSGYRTRFYSQYFNYKMPITFASVDCDSHFSSFIIGKIRNKYIRRMLRVPLQCLDRIHILSEFSPSFLILAERDGLD